MVAVFHISDLLFLLFGMLGTSYTRRGLLCEGQRDADANANETTLLFVGRVVGHVRLYGERGKGGAARYGHQGNSDEGGC